MAATGFWHIDAGDLLTSLIGIAGLLGIYFAYKQLRLGQRAQQTQLITQLYQEFSGNEERRTFLYRLDYSGSRRWLFDPDTFPHSPEERHVDGLLYFFSFVGTLTKHGDLSKNDLEWLVSECRIVLENPGIAAYLIWLKLPEQLPDHTSFRNAVGLYGCLVGENGHYRLLEQAYCVAGSPPPT